MKVVRTLATVPLTAGLLLAGPAALAAPASSASCGTGKLPAAVLGDPGVKAHQAARLYLWHGKNGYSIRVTHPGSARWVVSGTVGVSGDISAVKGVALEKGDQVKLSNDKKTLSFRFTNYGGIDGVDFAAECSRTVRVAVRTAGQPADPGQIDLGQHRVHPTSNPFTIERAK